MSNEHNKPDQFGPMFIQHKGPQHPGAVDEFTAVETLGELSKLFLANDLAREGDRIIPVTRSLIQSHSRRGQAISAARLHIAAGRISEAIAVLERE